MDAQGRQVLSHGDPEGDLEKLFAAVINKKEGQPVSVPMRMRNLPPSFFSPPPNQPKGGASAAAYPGPPPTSQMSPHNLPIAHSRAHSSPASLQATQQASAQQFQHLRQQSYDPTAMDDLGPLPPGWEMAHTGSGQRYYLNHNNQTTTWEDPRKSLSTSSLNQPQSPAGTPVRSPGSMSPLSPSPAHSQQGLNNINNIPLPEGWEQATTPEGEIYFINHRTQTTTWLDPRLAMMQRQQSIPQHQQPPYQARSPTPQQQAQVNEQQRQQKLRLQRLQLERERLRMRQEQIMQQMALRAGQMPGEEQMNVAGMPPASQAAVSSASQNPTQTTSEMQTVTTTGMDPFLSSGTPYHSRDESADSGLGMSSNYSLPRTPEDFLSNVDEMDTSENTGAEKMQTSRPNSTQPQPGRGGGGMPDILDTMQGTNVDLGFPETEGSNVDSEELVPSLQEALSSDILNDVENMLSPSKIDNFLTWL
ncbi:YAP1 [Branchiostoma lanceolatum]|uniref:YAP1 protein n=1 Tax=Branchiostoma lanceolatum TaxID=7740 RepID=A0A8J9Z0P8_BRALA|nr:YAP1 [Branchiostoma lanceolatum]